MARGGRKVEPVMRETTTEVEIGREVHRGGSGGGRGPRRGREGERGKRQYDRRDGTGRG